MFEEILARIAECLDRRRIPYMVIGGQAVLLYGEPRLTRDIDITLGVDVDRLKDVLTAAADLSLNILPEKPESFVRQTMVLPAAENSSGIRVDFIFSLTPYEREAIQRAKRVSIREQEVSFASPEDLVIHKIFAGRPRDLEDVRSVLLCNDGLDFRYVRKWLKEFDSFSDQKNFLKPFEEILKGLKR